MRWLGFAALDIETQDWDRFVCGGLLKADGSMSIYWNPRALFEAVASYEGVIWTWAGGRYDMVWLAQMAILLGVPCAATMSGGQIVTLKIGKAVVKDGCKLYPVPLAVAAAIAGVEKLSTGLDCVCGDSCGGYCAIRVRGMSAVDRARLAEYLAGDLRAAASVVAALHALAEELGICLKSTVGASAWATLAVMGAPVAEWPKKNAPKWRDYRFAREGYYGGRTEVYRTRAAVVHRYDLNSAYPASLVNTPVPTGGYERLDAYGSSKSFDRGAPGVYRVSVRVPRMHVPPLPARGEGRLMFATGRFTGAWTRDELAEAVSLGARIERFIGAIVWSREEKIAAPFMEKFWGLRSRFGKKSPQGAWLKWFVNSLTGKLAMRPEGERIAIAPDPEKIKRCPAAEWCHDGLLCVGSTRCCSCICRKTCGKWVPIDKERMLWSIPTHQMADCMHVHWAAVLTAGTRMELARQLRAAGDDAAYCDTDSCYSRVPLDRRIGGKLGEWNDEGIGLDWRALAPKAYRYAEAEVVYHHAGSSRQAPVPTLTGEYHTRAKGVPDVDAIRFDNWAGWEGEKIAVALDRGVWGIKGGARRGKIFGRRQLSRSTHGRVGFVGGRIAYEDGSTRPLAWSEYVKLLQEGSI